MKQIKVLIVDDSAVVRQMYKAMLESDPEIIVVGTAADPYIAVQKIQKESPDVITLDIEMPRMDGLTFLKKIMTQAPMPVVVISNQTLRGADVAFKALEHGAADVMGKPVINNQHQLLESSITLIDRVKSAYQSKKKLPGETKKVQALKSCLPISASTSDFSGSINCIAIGASTGGTEAIKSILQALPKQMPPILIVQHMPEKFTHSFATRLNESCILDVKEAEDGEIPLRGKVYIAPGGKHMKLEKIQGRPRIKIFTGDLVNRHRPSVNVLFQSVAEANGRNAVGVILTGMGDDGATGLLAMHQRGAYTIGQDENSCVVYGMPFKAKLQGGVADELPLDQIPSRICEKLREKVKTIE